MPPVVASKRGSGHHHVFFLEPAGKPLVAIMTELRAWLDKHKIEVSWFSHTVVPSGAVEVHLTFNTSHDAGLFERAFCRPDLTPARLHT